MEKTVDKKLNRGWVVAALALGVTQSLFGGLTAERSPSRHLSSVADSEDPHVVAVIRTAEGTNVKGDLCKYRQKVHRMQVYADGRVMELSTVRSMSCKGRERIEKSQSGSPVYTRIPAEKVEEILAYLREKSQESLARLAAQPRGLASSEDEVRGGFNAVAELTHSVSWSVGRDWLGTLNPIDLPTVLEPTAEGLDVGRRIQEEIRSAFVK